MDLDLYEHLLRRSLEAGVPSGVVADVFALDHEVAKALQRELDIKRFGTADQQEYIDRIQWLTLERTYQMIEHGSPEQAARLAQAVFGKQIQAAGKRMSSEQEDRQSALLERLGSMRTAPPERVSAGRFVVGRVDVDRRANQGEDDDE